MNFDSITLSSLFEKSLIRITANFNSEKKLAVICSELSKETKRKVSSTAPGPYNIELKSNEDGSFTFTTAFMTYRDSRLIIISLLKWIDRFGKTIKSSDFIIDLKFNDTIEGPFKGTLFNTSTKIESVDKLKFILDFDEAKVYDNFPSRRNGYTSQSIQKFDPIQKFIPKENESIDPKLYTIPSTENAGVRFETLLEGYLRLQYIGGSDYQKKVVEILNILNEFCVTAWNCVVNKGFSSDNISKFQKLIKKTEKIRESYLDYALFKKNFPEIYFTVDLLDNDKMKESYFNILRDRLYDLLTNIEFKGELELNYDTAFRTFQIKDGNIKCGKISNVEFLGTKIEFGNFDKCDFYDCNIKDGLLQNTQHLIVLII